jgi:alpha-glucosidase
MKEKSVKRIGFLKVCRPIAVVFLGFLLMAGSSEAKDHELKSPGGDIVLNIRIEENITIAVSFKGERILSPSPLSLNVKEWGILGNNPQVIRSRRETIDRMAEAVVPEKNRMIREHCNELRLDFRGDTGFTSVLMTMVPPTDSSPTLTGK